MGEARSGRGHAVSALFRDDGGFAQLGVVIAVMLTIALLFTSAQACWVESNSADVQNAADLGALAAENVVGEYMVVARLADAVIFTMSITALVLFGASAVAACIPGVDALAPELVSAAERILRSRDAFADKAISSLDKLQAALPYLCAVNSAVVIGANGSESPISPMYLGIALPVPTEAEATAIPRAEEVDSAGREIAENDEEVGELSDEMEKAEGDMNAAKLAGFEADCADGGSQRERADRLAGLSPVLNPDCHSVDLWSFQMAIDRSKAYYAARARMEEPESSSPEELSRSVARGRFYRYASNLLEQAYVTTDAEGVTTAYVPFLPKNTDEVRATELFTESVYPVSADGVLHASTACPACGGAVRTASLLELDAGGVRKCPTCNYSVTVIGRTPAASTSIDNGYEYYYREVATAAAAYSEASRRYADAAAEAKQTTQESVDEFSEALESFKSRRYDPKPPGRYGCVAVAVDPSAHESPFSIRGLVGEAQIGPRVAISAAVLAPEEASDGANVISSLLAGMSEEATDAGGAWLAEQLLGLWGRMLLAYSTGTEAFLDGLEEVLDSALGGAGGGLASWARRALEDEAELMGLQPVKLDSLRPALINTSHVLAHSDGGLDSLLGGVRGGYDVLTSDTIALSFSIGEGIPDMEFTIDLEEMPGAPTPDAEGIASALAEIGSGGGGSRWR